MFGALGDGTQNSSTTPVDVEYGPVPKPPPTPTGPTPTPITVTTTVDELNSDGDCSLREAIQAANTDTAVDACAAGSGADFITVPAGTYMLTIAGAGEDANATGDLDITDSLTINGAGAATTIIDGAALDRVFDTSGAVEISGLTIRNGSSDYDYGTGGIENRGTLTINNSIVSGNSSTGYSGTGGIENRGTLTINNSIVSGNSSTGYSGTGGIKNPSYRTLTINNSTVSGNSATGTGGIKNFQSASLTINNSTISGNSGVGYSGNGGIYNFQSAILTINNSTVSGNSATGPNGAGGIMNIQSAILTINNSTVSGNTAPGGGTGTGGIVSGPFASATLKNTIIANSGNSDCAGKFTSTGNNLDSDGSCGLAATGDISNVNPLLGLLADNGGPTQTHALLAGSPALDASSGDCPPPADDQLATAGPVSISGATALVGTYGFELGLVATPTPIPSDSDGDGLNDAFEAGFGPGASGAQIQIDNPEIGNTATATGSAAAGATITSGSLTVIFPPGTTIDTSLDSKILIKFVPGALPQVGISGADLAGQTKTVEMPLGSGSAVCIDDRATAKIGAGDSGTCPAPPDDPNVCPSGKIEIAVPTAFSPPMSVSVLTKTQSPECTPTTYTVTRVSATRIKIEGLVHTTTGILSGSVGGIAELPEVAGTPLETDGSSGPRRACSRARSRASRREPSL